MLNIQKKKIQWRLFHGFNHNIRMLKSFDIKQKDFYKLKKPINHCHQTNISSVSPPVPELSESQRGESGWTHSGVK